MDGSFSAVWTATIATKYSFCRVFEPFFEIYKIFILLHRSDLKISAKNRPNFCQNLLFFEFFSRFSMNFAIFRRNFSENLPEFHRNCQETTKCIEILRKSATNIRKMLEISGICEKISFFISFFHSSPYFSSMPPPCLRRIPSTKA